MSAPAAPSASTNLPSFSIIVPTYQRRDAVLGCVGALCSQSYAGERELIIVVDGSTDGTAAALQNIECPVPIRIIEQPNGGLANARNRGAAEAMNEVLLFLDDDMICEADLIERHAASHLAGADAVVGDCPATIRPGSEFLSVIVTDGRYRKDIKLTAFDIFCGHLSVRRAVFEEVGGFDERFTEGGKYGDEDIDFGKRLLERHKVVHNHLAVCHQRVLVGPREQIRRARALAVADIAFAAKHPELATELFRLRGQSHMTGSLRIVSGLRFVPDLLAELSSYAAEAAAWLRLGSRGPVRRLFSSGYALAYWSAVKRNGGIPHL